MCSERWFPRNKWTECAAGIACQFYFMLILQRIEQSAISTIQTKLLLFSCFSDFYLNICSKVTVAWSKSTLVQSSRLEIPRTDSCKKLANFAVSRMCSSRITAPLRRFLLPRFSFYAFEDVQREFIIWKIERKLKKRQVGVMMRGGSR